MEVVYPARDQEAWREWLRRRATVVGGTIALLVVTGGAYLITRPPTGCAASPARKHALAVIAGHQDRTTGEPVERRYPRERFDCSDVASPSGVLVTASEQEDAPPAIWFVDARGQPHNVNMLALAWTPEFPTAPEGVGTLPGVR
jgi:hypothetical protein